MLKIFIRKFDLIGKHDEGIYMNDDDQDDSDKKDGSQEGFSNVVEKKYNSLNLEGAWWKKISLSWEGAWIK